MTANEPGDNPATEGAGWTEITLEGELDASTIDEVRVLLTFDKPPHDLRIDMAGVTYIDSALLNVLFRVAKECPTTLIAPPGTVRRIAMISGLDQLVRISDPL